LIRMGDACVVYASILEAGSSRAMYCWRRS
jgi:hypothetical protein